MAIFVILKRFLAAWAQKFHRRLRLFNKPSMSSASLPTLLNLRLPINDPVLAGSAALLTPLWQSFFTNLNRELLGLATFNPANYGATGNGRADDTAGVQGAINAAIQAGGGLIQFDAGTFSINTVTIPAGTAPVFLQGVGLSTVIVRRSVLTVGEGLFDVSGSNVWFSNMLIDGATTAPKGLQYGVDFNGIGGNDPMANSLTQNSSVWVHGGATNINFQFVKFQHAGGYSILLDATAKSIDDVHIERCQFFNNRPTLFGTVPGQLIYGSWNGGILAQSDGRTAGSSIVSSLLVARCHFARNTGNCCWSHAYGLDQLNEDFRFVENYFVDCGLDGIEVGSVTNGVVMGNTFRRIGYIALNDSSPATPRWLNGLNATALDSSGLVINVPYTNNSFLDINGGAIDMDGHGQSSITGNVVRVAAPGDPEYVEDQVAICGPTNSGQMGYGINLSNTSNTALGASNITIVGNQFVNLMSGSIRLFAGRDCLVEGNNIISPNAPSSSPISLGPIGVGPNQRATRNKICHNRITYSTVSVVPAIFEDPSVSPFVATDVNYVYSNVPLFPIGTSAFEFKSDASSGSPTFASTVWFP